MDLTAYFGSFCLATDLGLVFVRKLVIDSVIEVQIVELLILPVYLAHSLPELNCAPILQQRLYVIKICKLKVVELLLFVNSIERAVNH